MGGPAERPGAGGADSKGSGRDATRPDWQRFVAWAREPATVEGLAATYALAAGLAAFRDGVPFALCPFDATTEPALVKGWRDGWKIEETRGAAYWLRPVPTTHAARVAAALEDKE